MSFPKSGMSNQIIRFMALRNTNRTAVTEATLALVDLATNNPPLHLYLGLALQHNVAEIKCRVLQLHMCNVYMEWEWSQDCHVILKSLCRNMDSVSRPSSKTPASILRKWSGNETIRKPGTVQHSCAGNQEVL